MPTPFPRQVFASNVNGTLIIPAAWQSAWNATYNVLNMVGCVAAGYIQDMFGRRAVFLAAIICASAGIATCYVSQTPAQYLGGKIVSGFAVGLVLAGPQTYVSEIAPLPMRGIALSTNTVMLVSQLGSMYSRRSSAYELRIWAFSLGSQPPTAGSPSWTNPHSVSSSRQPVRFPEP